MALIELPALVGALLPDSEQQGILATVAGHRVAFSSSSGRWWIVGWSLGGPGLPGVRRLEVAVLAVHSVQGLASLQVARGLGSWRAGSGGGP